MGHYDSCYASDDYLKMTKKEKQGYFKEFEKELRNSGEIYRYFDDFLGLLLEEWAEINECEYNKENKTIFIKQDPLYFAAKKAIREHNDI